MAQPIVRFACNCYLNCIFNFVTIRHSRTCRGGRGAIAPQVSKIWAKFKFFGQRYEKFGQSQEFQGIDIDQLQKLVTKFK